MNRTPSIWFPGTLVFALMTAAFLGGFALGISITLYAARRSAPPPLRARVEARASEPRVRTHTGEVEL